MKRLVDVNKITYEEWLKYRKIGVTGTDAGAIASMNPYKSALQVFVDKTTDKSDIFDNESMRQGRDLEEYVAQRFCELTGKKVRRANAVFVSDEHPFMLADFDRLIVGEKAGLECKTVSAYSADKWKNGAIPLHYQLQVQHYLAVSGYEAWYIAALILGKEFIVHRIDRDEELIQNLIVIEKRFWEQNVLAGVMPDPDGSRMADEVLANYFPQQEGVSVLLPQKLENRLKRRKELVTLIDKLETEKSIIEQEVKKYLGDSAATEAENENFFVRWKNIETSRVDVDRLRKEEPDIYERFKKTTSSKRLTIRSAA